MPSVLILGRGSAAQRHERVLAGMGDVTDYAVIASRTEHHERDLVSLNGFTGKCLVEKPLSASGEYGFEIYVGYQLRFCEAIKNLKRDLAERKVLAVSICSGQHLSFWKGTRQGVIADYSHEIDIIQYLFGEIQNVVGLSAHEESAAAFVMRTENCPLVSLYLNYFENPPRREIVVSTDRGTLRADIVMDDNSTRLMHEDVLSGGGEACTYEQGMAVDAVIARMRA